MIPKFNRCKPAAAVIAAIAMMGTSLPLISMPAMASTVAYNSQTTDGSYLITTEQQLKDLASIVNAGTFAYDGSTFYLGNNISLASAWTPIGTSANPFKGNFDGEGYTLSGLSVSSSASYLGVFGRINTGYVDDLSVSGSITITTDDQYVGSIVGYTDSSIYNCHSSVTINQSTGTGSQAVGGIAGAVENASTNVVKVRCCSNTGTVNAGRRVGGIVGAVYCTSNAKIWVDRCYNTANITANYSTKLYSGGIVGYCRGYILNCYNTGTVHTQNDGHYIGGIAGIIQGSSPTGAMYNCYNAGDVTGTGTDYMKPLVSSVDSSSAVCIKNCYWDTDVITSGITQPTTDTTWGTCTNVSGLTTTNLKAAASALNVDSNVSGETTYPYGFFTTISGQYPGLTTPSAATSADLTIGYNTRTNSDATTGMIYLDGTAATNGSGTLLSPCNTLSAAVTAAQNASATVIYVTGTVPVSTSQTIDTTITIKRSSIFDGNLFQVQSGGTLTIASGVTIDGNKANNTYADSALIAVEGGTLTMNGGTLTNNHTGSGGGVRIASGSFTMNGGTISNNDATKYGGGVQVVGGTFTLAGGTITGNTAASEGSAVGYFEGNFVINASSLTVSGVVYIASDMHITATAIPSSTTVTVKSQSPASDLVIATASSDLSGRFAYVNSAYSFGYDAGEIFLV